LDTNLVARGRFIHDNVLCQDSVPIEPADLVASPCERGRGRG
jgi:hypothetical protein